MSKLNDINVTKSGN